MAILVHTLFATVVLLFGVLMVFILLSTCRLAESETGQISRDEEKQAAAKGLLYEHPKEQEVSRRAGSFFHRRDAQKMNAMGSWVFELGRQQEGACFTNDERP